MAEIVRLHTVLLLQIEAVRFLLLVMGLQADEWLIYYPCTERKHKSATCFHELHGSNFQHKLVGVIVIAQQQTDVNKSSTLGPILTGQNLILSWASEFHFIWLEINGIKKKKIEKMLRSISEYINWYLGLEGKTIAHEKLKMTHW